MSNYIVTSVEPGALIGGNKAKDDVTYFLTQKDGFKKMNIIEKKGKLSKLFYSQFKLKKKIINSKADNFVLQHPVASEFLEDSFIKLVHRKANAKLFILIHDISSLQYPDVVGEGYQNRELGRFNKADGLIVHNSAMKKWLLNHGVEVPMVELGVFDYQTDNQMQREIPFERSICFAGGLGRANFLQKLNINHSLHIMGPNRLDNYPPCVKYDGQFTPDELAPHLLQNFGLVWSGNSTDTCSGYLGQYLKYNDPHKVSLYLSNGIPVIIWAKAALADFVKKNDVGIIVNDLNILDKVLNEIDKERYSRMKYNARKIGTKIRQGHFIINAVNSIISCQQH